MPVMRTVGAGHQPPAHARVREEPAVYVIELDVSEFTEDELSVEALGPQVTVRGDQRERPQDAVEPFRLHERLEETFRLPDDADAGQITAVHRHGTLEVRAPRRPLSPRAVPIEHPAPTVNPDAEAC